MAAAKTPFHPIIEAWFSERFGEPTEPQKRGWPAIQAGGHALIAAPTGSGKTLAAFLSCIDTLLQQALEGRLPDAPQVLYVSPLRALSHDIRKNLEVPLREIGEAAGKAGRLIPPLRVLVRTGDTPAHERASMLKKPPHILVTTPESLFVLLTSAGGRKMLGSVKTVIVDEIHALARDKRGSHLALSLERLEALCGGLQRVGLSATQRPIEEMARLLTGSGRPEAKIIDSGHLRKLDLGIELPESELSAVCSNEQWAEVDAKIVDLIQSHRSTVIFVNTRRMAERLSHRLREKLGEDAVAGHHGSLSREIRLDVEERLKAGKLKAIVATASLELGIDIGYIDLVCQIGSPRSIAAFLQRVGRSGHALGALPKGRLVALTRDELLESLALIRAVKSGRLDRIEPPARPLDILMQQIVAEVAAQDWDESDLYNTFHRSWPYRDLPRAEFDRLIGLLSEGMARGRKEGAYLHRDAVHGQLKARRGARLAALTSGGAIPETADYRVVTEGERTFVGTVNEDFAIESMAGDVFLLGNTSWRVRAVRGGEVIVSDAQGAPATVPFWLGEAPGRTVELSAEVSDLRHQIAESEEPLAWLERECGASGPAAAQALAYVEAQKAALGFVPTQKKILFERFFDETGGMQLVIHSPYGVRINRAWGLALRKRFCRNFDFELQASADDNGIVLSIGVQHSFPLEEMFSLVSKKSAKAVLVQALLAAPMFQVRWRWNATRALAVLRSRGGKKVPPPLQRFRSDDLLTAVFPLQTACFEHRPPEVPLPDHPLVAQTVHDCLHEAMDIDAWEALLESIEKKDIELVARDTREPSPFSHSILNTNPYNFLDDAPLEERRARAVATRRILSPEGMRDLAKLDPEAIARVREDAQPLVREPDELHDLLLTLGILPQAEGKSWTHFFDKLSADGRAAQTHGFWYAAERWPWVKALFPDAQTPLALPDSLKTQTTPEAAAVEVVRGRLALTGPVTAKELSTTLGLSEGTIQSALAALELEGAVLQGDFTGSPDREWCDRRLLARIHRLTLEGARKRVAAVEPAAYWRFLASWHRLDNRRAGRLGLHEAIGQLQGFEAPASAWESDLLPGRVAKYQPEWLDTLSFSGELSWARLRPPKRTDPESPTTAAINRAAPLALAFRPDLPWLLDPERPQEIPARPNAETVHQALIKHGALFLDDLAEVTGLPPAQVREALGELAALGRVTSDGFSALRELVLSRPLPRQRRVRWAPGGRWTIFPGRLAPGKPEDRAEGWARQLLKRYGVIFRDLLAREAAAPAWWELSRVYRRLESRGEVRGGRFVSGVAGEQYALPEAVELLRRPAQGDQWAAISSADPLNLAGILIPGPRIPAGRGNRILLKNGEVAALMQAGQPEFRQDFSPVVREKIARLLRLQVAALRDQALAELLESVRAA